MIWPQRGPANTLAKGYFSILYRLALNVALPVQSEAVNLMYTGSLKENLSNVELQHVMD